jgi:hypothetical protein
MSSAPPASPARPARALHAARLRLCAAVALAALALTACQNGGGVRDEGPSGLPGTSIHDTSGPTEGAPCTGSHLRTTAAPLSRPANHLLLTVTNTGAVNCTLTGYPKAVFGESASAAPLAREQRPRSTRITLSPGESAYAGVVLSAADGTGRRGRTVKTLTIAIPGGPAARPALPAKGVYVDDTLRVTYWLSNRDAALTY